jgi:hypothetical protein
VGDRDRTGARGCDRGCGQDLSQNAGGGAADPAYGGGKVAPDGGGPTGNGHN